MQELGNVLVFDTETTGRWDFKAPLDDPRQPYMIQLGYALYSQDGRQVLASNSLVYPPCADLEQITIPTHIHGISLDHVNAFHIDVELVAQNFLQAIYHCNTMTAYNRDYDMKILDKFFHDMPGDYREEWQDAVKSIRHVCTMRSAKAAMGLGQYDRGGKLFEAYRYFMGHDMRGAHDALADVTATYEIFNHLAATGKPLYE